MFYDELRPCACCPFRTDGAGVGHLNAARAEEIARVGCDDDHEVFWCHQTKDMPVARRNVCSGWLRLRLAHPEEGLPLIARLWMLQYGTEVPVIAVPLATTVEAFVAWQAGEDRDGVTTIQTKAAHDAR